MLLRSGASKLIQHPETSDLMSVSIFCMWKIDRDYDAFLVEALDWYNASFDVAMEEAGTDKEMATLARIYHYQLIYHLYHSAALKQPGKELIQHAGAMYVKPEYR
jgi:hypothetical protein